MKENDLQKWIFFEKKIRKNCTEKCMQQEHLKNIVQGMIFKLSA